MAVRNKSRIPEIMTAEEEASFWDTHSLAEFEDELKIVRRTDVARPLEHHLSVRLDARLLTELLRLAKRRGLGPSTLAQTWLKERIEQERNAEQQH